MADTSVSYFALLLKEWNNKVFKIFRFNNEF